MRKGKMKVAAVLLSVLSIFTILFHVPAFTTSAGAATNLTSIGLAEYAINAYNDGWKYNYGSAGEKNSNGYRQSDCSGLIYAFFTDNGTTGPRTVTQQAATSVQDGDVSNIPRVHGLVITIPNYDHIGVYIGNGEVVDNSDYGVDMRWGKVNSNRSWIKWHMMGNVNYPTNGYYAFNGNMYHYTDRQYDINTTVTHGGVTFTIGEDGVLCDESGSPIAVDTSMPNDGFSGAAPIPGYDGGATAPDGSTPAEVTGAAVRVRAQPTTDSSVVTILSKGTTVYVTEEVTGDVVNSDGQASTTWYKITTGSGQTGYMTALFLKLSAPVTPTVAVPAITYQDGYVTMAGSDDDAAIYYTTDCSDPTEESSIYSGPIYNMNSTTYRAIAVKGNSASSVSMLTVLTNDMVFTDLYTSKWYFPSVENALQWGLFSGDGNNTFRPDSDITRAEFVLVLANLAGVDLTAYENVEAFTDVDPTAWYAKAVAWSKASGYINGFADGTFKPNDKITREQMCQIIATYGGLTRTADSAAFDDDASISSWAKNAVYACRDNNIISGVGDNRFAPASEATRAQAAAVVVKLISY